MVIISIFILALYHKRLCYCAKVLPKEIKKIIFHTLEEKRKMAKERFFPIIMIVLFITAVNSVKDLHLASKVCPDAQIVCSIIDK